MDNFSEDIIDLSVDEFKVRRKEAPGIVIDVRTAGEYGQGYLRISSAQYDFLNGEFHDEIENLDPEKTYYLYCRSGNRSGQAARLLRSRGFEKAYNIGGYEALAESGVDED